MQQAVRASSMACGHGGLSGDGYGEVVWDEDYTVPSDAGEDVCNYPLARSLVLLTVSVLAEVVIGFVAHNERRAFALTLGDLKINQTR